VGWGDWSWHSDKTGNKTEVVPSCGLDEFIREIAKDMIGSMVDEKVATVLYD
jgi:hypothetical protein